MMYNTSYIEIAKHNAISNPNVICVGQVLQTLLKSQSPIVATPCYIEQTILAHTSNYSMTRDESVVVKRDGSYNMSSATRANVIALVKKLMKEYNIPISNVVRHYDVTHKKCPAYFVNDTQAWIQLLNELVA